MVIFPETLNLVCNNFLFKFHSLITNFFSRVFSMLEPEYVAEEIVAGVLTNKELILMPKMFYFLNILKS